MRRRSLWATALAIFTLAMTTGAWAASVPYYGNSNWAPGVGSSSAFSSAWFYNIMSKRGKFDSTITFIDNTSYSWHSTFRGPGEYITAVWMSSAVKKAHCRSNVTASIHASCAVVS